MGTPLNTEADFWRHVERGDGCWVWHGGRNARGYGRISFDRKSRLAHRLAWVFTNGPILDGLCVCHHCDNPCCVNPEHLFLGTQADNSADMARKGRGRSRPPRGSANHMAKLVESDVIEIRRLLALGIAQTWIGPVYGVTNCAVSLIASGRNWGHLREDVALCG